MNIRQEQNFSYAVLLAVPLLVYLVFVISPILVSFGLSFSKWKYFRFQEFNAWENYLKILTDPKFWHAFNHNIQIVLVSILGQIPLAFFLAYSMHRRLIRGKVFFTSMIFLPVTTSPIVVALLWNRIFSPVGLYTGLVRWLTNDADYVIQIFEDPNWAMVPILFVLLWMHTSIYLVIFLANLQRIPVSIFEAAALDGASESNILWRITVPLLGNTLFSSSVLAITGSLKSFDLVFAMTGGGPVDYTNVLAIYTYQRSFTTGDFGYGSAVSSIVALLSIGLVLLMRWGAKRFDNFSEGHA